MKIKFSGCLIFIKKIASVLTSRKYYIKKALIQWKNVRMTNV